MRPSCRHFVLRGVWVDSRTGNQKRCDLASSVLSTSLFLSRPVRKDSLMSTDDARMGATLPSPLIRSTLRLALLVVFVFCPLYLTSISRSSPEGRDGDAWTATRTDARQQAAGLALSQSFHRGTLGGLERAHHLSRLWHPQGRHVQHADNLVAAVPPHH